jgi:hypothetical protein
VGQEQNKAQTVEFRLLFISVPLCPSKFESKETMLRFRRGAPLRIERHENDVMRQK